MASEASILVADRNGATSVTFTLPEAANLAVRIAMRRPADKAMWLNRHLQLQDTANAA